VIVVDASIALKLVFNEPSSARARAAWETWTERGEVIVAPALFRAETLSVIRRKAHQGTLSEADAERARHGLENLVIEIREPVDLYDVAWEFARRYNHPTIYDCCYLALAAVIGCELWTADLRLAHSVQPALSWIRIVED
jgi:predicted nucleic acid-binding protein